MADLISILLKYDETRFLGVLESLITNLNSQLKFKNDEFCIAHIMQKNDII